MPHKHAGDSSFISHTHWGGMSEKCIEARAVIVLAIRSGRSPSPQNGSAGPNRKTGAGSPGHHTSQPASRSQSGQLPKTPFGNQEWHKSGMATTRSSDWSPVHSVAGNETLRLLRTSLLFRSCRMTSRAPSASFTLASHRRSRSCRLGRGSRKARNENRSRQRRSP